MGTGQSPSVNQLGRKDRHIHQEFPTHRVVSEADLTLGEPRVVPDLWMGSFSPRSRGFKGPVQVTWLQKAPWVKARGWAWWSPWAGTRAPWEEGASPDLEGLPGVGPSLPRLLAIGWLVFQESRPAPTTPTQTKKSFRCWNCSKQKTPQTAVPVTCTCGGGRAPHRPPVPTVRPLQPLPPGRVKGFECRGHAAFLCCRQASSVRTIACPPLYSTSPQHRPIFWSPDFKLTHVRAHPWSSGQAFLMQRETESPERENVLSVSHSRPGGGQS